jgi:hypothetical protein
LELSKESIAPVNKIHDEETDSESFGELVDEIDATTLFAAGILVLDECDEGRNERVSAAPHRGREALLVVLLLLAVVVFMAVAW